MNSKEELISYFPKHSIHELDDAYARLKVLSKDDAITYRKHAGLDLLMSGNSYPVGIIKDGRLLALAIGVPHKEDSVVLNKRIVSMEWLTIDQSTPFEDRKKAASQLLQNCRTSWRESFDMASALIDFDQYDILELLQENGAKIYGGNYTWVCKSNKVADSIFSKDSLEKINLFRQQDVQGLIKCVKESYATYRSHYHADSHFDANFCSDTYLSSVRNHVANNGEVVIAKNTKGEITGFSTINPHHEVNKYFNNNLVGEIAISGVSPFARGGNTYESMLIKGIEFFRTRGFRYVVFGCNANNYVVQSIWIKLGNFRPRRFCYRVHWWL